MTLRDRFHDRFGYPFNRPRDAPSEEEHYGVVWTRIGETWYETVLRSFIECQIEVYQVLGTVSLLVSDGDEDDEGNGHWISLPVKSVEAAFELVADINLSLR